MNDVPEELAQLSSLRFAPTSPATHRSSRHDAPSQTRTNLIRESQRLETVLQDLVVSLKQALFNGTTDIVEIRTSILTTMSDLLQVMTRRSDQDGLEVLKLMAQREDCDTTRERIERLQDDFVPSETESYDVQSKELQKVEMGIKDLKAHLSLLESRRVELKQSLRKLETARLDGNKERQKELTQLRQLPTRETLTLSINTLQGDIQLEESEVVALTEGSNLFSDIVTYLSDSEAMLKQFLQTRQYASVSGKLNDIIETLDHWLTLIYAKNWKLLMVVLELERECYLRAKREWTRMNQSDHEQSQRRADDDEA